jgi:mono/diheme cytochrome c family protein
MRDSRQGLLRTPVLGPMNRRVGLAVTLLALAVQSAAAADGPRERGRRLYVAVGCVHCHGTAGQGSSAGNALVPSSLPAAALASFIRSKNTTMPAYRADVLNDAAVADIAVFLASLPVPRDADVIPALRSLRKDAPPRRSTP